MGESVSSVRKSNQTKNGRSGNLKADSGNIAVSYTTETTTTVTNTNTHTKTKTATGSSTTLSVSITSNEIPSFGRPGASGTAHGNTSAIGTPQLTVYLYSYEFGDKQLNDSWSTSSFNTGFSKTDTLSTGGWANSWGAYIDKLIAKAYAPGGNFPATEVKVWATYTTTTQTKKTNQVTTTKVTSFM